MKQLICSVVILCMAISALTQRVAINNDQSLPDNSAILDIKSTDKGILVPRMTTAQRLAIQTPALGLLVFDTDSRSFWFYGNSEWTNLTTNTTSTGANWKLSGNNNIDPSIDFIGTNDSASLVFKVNNEQFGIMNKNGSLALGFHAGLNNSGKDNISLGTNALFSNLTRSNIIAIGDSALFFNEKNATNSSQGQLNLAIGSKALYSNTTGSYNNAIGYKALASNITGGFNVALGHQTLRSNSQGAYNIAIGKDALFFNSTGGQNIAIGDAALKENENGFYNVAIGSGGLSLNKANFNTALGTYSLTENVTGRNNVAVGYSALSNNTTGYSNVAIGSMSLRNNYDRSQLVAIGDSSLYYNGLGASATYHATENTGIGSKSLFSNTTGYRNTALGKNSLLENSTGYANVAIGYRAMEDMTTGFANTAVGSNAYLFVSTGSFNTMIGFGATVTSQPITNSTAIGNGATVSASNQIRLGNSSVTSIGGGVSWSSISDGRFKKNIIENVPGLSFINKLRPVTYKLDKTAINEFHNRASRRKTEMVNQDETHQEQIWTGFVAQEVEQTASSLGYEFSGVDKPEDPSKQTYALRYSEFVVPIVKAIQEQQKLIEDQQRQIEELKTALRELLKKS